MATKRIELPAQPTFAIRDFYGMFQSYNKETNLYLVEGFREKFIGKDLFRSITGGAATIEKTYHSDKVVRLTTVPYAHVNVFFTADELLIRIMQLIRKQPDGNKSIWIDYWDINLFYVVAQGHVHAITVSWRYGKENFWVLKHWNPGETCDFEGRHVEFSPVL